MRRYAVPGIQQGIVHPSTRKAIPPVAKNFIFFIISRHKRKHRNLLKKSLRFRIFGNPGKSGGAQAHAEIKIDFSS